LEIALQSEPIKKQSPTPTTPPVNTLIIELDEKHTSIDPDEHISCYVWKFGSSIFQTGSHDTPTLSVNKVTSTNTTVTDDSGT